MTDLELVSRAIGFFEPAPSHLSKLSRRGRILLCVPHEMNAARMALGLYQPQRTSARCITGALKVLARRGMHGLLLPRLSVPSRKNRPHSALNGIVAGTCGILLGSPEHRVRRAIVSYKMNDAWEVAKISIGAEGKSNLQNEASILLEMHRLVGGVPEMLGLHHEQELTILRMPYLSGTELKPGHHADAISLLESWIQEAPSQSASLFNEWESIEIGLKAASAHESLIQQLANTTLRSVICHGDFARWNLRKQSNGEITALDWEWGHRDGMPGIDLIHFFMQDMRLVHRLSPSNAIEATLTQLLRPQCINYLSTTGWGGKLINPIIASLAYKQGTGQQDSIDVLREACLMAMQ